MFSSVFECFSSGFEWAFFVFGCRKVDFSAFFDLERPRWPVAGPSMSVNFRLENGSKIDVLFCVSGVFLGVSGCFRVILGWF